MKGLWGFGGQGKKKSGLTLRQAQPCLGACILPSGEEGGMAVEPSESFVGEGLAVIAEPALSSGYLHVFC